MILQQFVVKRDIATVIIWEKGARRIQEEWKRGQEREDAYLLHNCTAERCQPTSTHKRMLWASRKDVLMSEEGRRLAPTYTTAAKGGPAGGGLRRGGRREEGRAFWLIWGEEFVFGNTPFLRSMIGASSGHQGSTLSELSVLVRQFTMLLFFSNVFLVVKIYGDVISWECIFRNG